MGIFYNDDEVTIYTVKYDPNGRVQKGNIVYGRTDTPDSVTKDTVIEGKSYHGLTRNPDYRAPQSRVIKVSPPEQDLSDENMVEVYKTMSTSDRKLISGITQSLVQSGAIDDPEAHIEAGDDKFEDFYKEASLAAQRDNEVSPFYAYSDEELEEKYGVVEDPEFFEEMYTDNISEPSDEEEVEIEKKEERSVTIESTDGKEIFLDQKQESVEQFNSGQSREIPRAEFHQPVPVEKKVSIEDMMIVQRMIKKGLSDSDIADILDTLSSDDIAKLRENF